MKGYFTITLLTISFISPICSAQTTFEITNEIVSSSDLENVDDEVLGSGWADHVRASVTFPIHFAECDSNPRIIWRGNVTGTYTYLHNDGGAKLYNPDEVYTLHTSLINMRPLGGRWSFMGVVNLGFSGIGEGFNLRDIVLNAGAIFAYNHSRTTSYGFCAFLFTRYGVPIIFPFPFYRYTSENEWQFDIGILGRIQAVAKRKYSEKFTLGIDMLSIESTASNVYVEGKWKVYSTSTMKSAVCPEFSLGEWGTLTVEAGVAWRRSTTLSDRSYSGFFKNFNHRYRRVFRTAADIEVGYKRTF